ncbi:AraC family transcriptional regulator [Anaerocolumna sp. MB42-C2]|uniref:AraC family transcriptional regulator n=1 Tax=Anaerocolumna sp. MB42-C2 TaxID=3070997 RepID=UPI0027E0A1BA|nr:AraC family transcriptional regulator [Anaerocolumna sp. MB42-C2]WMJ88055.1 AraC family transcriptional regulator [Anaerocolumna sp. MB42-C2]
MQYIDYNERKIRGTFDFPIEFYHIDSQHPQYAMPYHWHVEYEIIRILEGSFTVSLDENEFQAEHGDVIFINSGTLHAGIPNNCIYECIVFDMNMLMKKDTVCQKYIQDIMNHVININQFYKKQSSEFHKAVWQLFDVMDHKSYGYQLIVQGCLYQFLGIILEHGDYVTDSLQTPQNHRRILQLKQVLELIENSYPDQITLDQLSKAAGMSPKYFCRFFQEMTHKSPIDYLNYYRVERACYQLLNTDTSITDISYGVGFNDLSYFIKSFKKYKGITPAKYRKLNYIPVY